MEEPLAPPEPQSSVLADDIEVEIERPDAAPVADIDVNHSALEIDVSDIVGEGAMLSNNSALSLDLGKRTTSFFSARKSKKERSGQQGALPQPSISVKEWDPDVPYLKVMKGAEQDQLYNEYLRYRTEYQNSPAFYIDCATFFFETKQIAAGIRVLSNLAELELENHQLMRIMASKLAHVKSFDLAVMIFDQVLEMREEEPQSFRDLALVLAQRAQQNNSVDDYKRAIELLYQVVLGKWDRFHEIELIALNELNRIIPLARKAGLKEIPVDERLIKLLGWDIRVVMTWDADMTDMDLHIVEPSGEEAYFGHNRTKIGGLVSRDFTQGYGPEEYLVRRAMPGKYVIKTNYYGSSSAKLLGNVTLHVDIYTNYARENEKKQSITIQLDKRGNNINVGEIVFE